jgi:hypothetical protein
MATEVIRMSEAPEMGERIARAIAALRSCSLEWGTADVRVVPQCSWMFGRCGVCDAGPRRHRSDVRADRGDGRCRRGRK